MYKRYSAVFQSDKSVPEINSLVKFFKSVYNFQYLHNKVEMFYLKSTLNFGIPPVLLFQLEVYYEVDSLPDFKLI